MSRLRRPILHSRFFFVTTNLSKGLRPFNETEFGLLAEALVRTRENAPVAVCAYCFMPDHVHAILFPHREYDDFRRDDAVQGRCFPARPADSWPGILAGEIS